VLFADAVTSFISSHVFSLLVLITINEAVNIFWPALISYNMVSTRCMYCLHIWAVIISYVDPTPVIRYMLTKNNIPWRPIGL
jgi:hypothetical protein